jgi:hypothetical protein
LLALLAGLSGAAGASSLVVLRSWGIPRCFGHGPVFYRQSFCRCLVPFICLCFFLLITGFVLGSSIIYLLGCNHCVLASFEKKGWFDSEALLDEFLLSLVCTFDRILFI